MADSRKKIIFKNVAPAILANACVFLFSVVDGIFVGQGAGMDALGAVNIALPFVLIVQALNAMASIGGVTITAIRFGRGDKEGAQNAFMHSVTINFIVGCLVTLIGCGLTAPFVNCSVQPAITLNLQRIMCSGGHCLPSPTRYR